MKKSTQRGLARFCLFALVLMYVFFILIGFFTVMDTAEALEPRSTYEFVDIYEGMPPCDPITGEDIVEEPEQPMRVYYDVPLDRDMQDHIIDICESRSIEPALALALIKTESGYNPNCIGDNGNSKGLMQIQQRWHSARMEELGCSDLMDPYQNVTVGLDLFCDLLEYSDSVEWALMAYNGGSSYANKMYYSGRLSGYAEKVISESDRLIASVM